MGTQQSKKRRTMLVIDDEIEFHELVRAIFNGTHSVSGAKETEDALRLLRQVHFDVVLLDVRLPHRPGWDVLRVLSKRADAPPVIVVTAHGDQKVCDEAAALGAVCTVVKPIVPRQLRKMVAYCETLKG